MLTSNIRREAENYIRNAEQHQESTVHDTRSTVHREGENAWVGRRDQMLVHPQQGLQQAALGAQNWHIRIGPQTLASMQSLNVQEVRGTESMQSLTLSRGICIPDMPQTSREMP